jgi:hypothetical protein
MKEFLLSVFGPRKEGVGIRVQAGKGRSIIVAPEHVTASRADVAIPGTNKGISLGFNSRGDDLCVAGPVRGPGLSLRQGLVAHHELLTIHTPSGEFLPRKAYGVAIVNDSEPIIRNLAEGCDPSRHLVIYSSKAIKPGMSGSPVVDDDDQVVGALVKVARLNNRIGLIRLITPRDVEWQD